MPSASWPVKPWKPRANRISARWLDPHETPGWFPGVIASAAPAEAEGAAGGEYARAR